MRSDGAPKALGSAAAGTGSGAPGVLGAPKAGGPGIARRPEAPGAYATPRPEIPIARIHSAAYRIPTDKPESDGTFIWNATTMVVVHAEAGGECGVGYSYTAAAAVDIAEELLADAIRGADALAPTATHEAMLHATRNIGQRGLTASAIAAVDSALWDLKARLLDLPLVTLLGAVRERVPVYGSGGFTSQPVDELQRQLTGWVDAGIPRVKMKVGRDPARDLARVRAARAAIGPDAELFVDANGAYSRKQALAFAERFAELGVAWFEEPVPMNDVDGLRFARDRAPPGLEIAAGEYAYSLVDFRRLLDAGAVDVLQADATRCAGITEFVRVGALCRAHSMPLSAHTAPALHAHVCCAVPDLRHVEYFDDHARIERMLFDGAPEPADGALRPDLSRPGMGLEFRHRDAERFRVK